jgi:L-alanine-DL-glutamate epimerase-like enolase superfamily enzyme
MTVSGAGLKIEGFRAHRLSIPLPVHYVSGAHDAVTTENVLLELASHEFTGHGYAFAFDPAQADAIYALVAGLAASLLGHSVEQVRGVWERLRRDLGFVGQGAAMMALAVIDSAMWDLLGQRANTPLYLLLGGCTDSLGVYASGGWFTYSKEELAEEATRFAAEGYQGYKIKVGHEDWRTDVERVEYILSAVGDSIPVMVDANQAWPLKTALAAGRALHALGVDWLEEPVTAGDLQGHARLTASLDIRVATGESVFGRDEFSRLIDARAADVVMPNMMRLGGPSQVMQVANFADLRAVEVSSHTLMEVSAHVMAACPNAALVEHIPGWWDTLFEGAPEVRDGRVRLTRRPGLGFTFAERAIRDFSCRAGTVVGGRTR